MKGTVVAVAALSGVRRLMVVGIRCLGGYALAS